MEDAIDFKGICTDAIDDEKRQPTMHRFSLTRFSARPTPVGESLQTICGFLYTQSQEAGHRLSLAPFGASYVAIGKSVAQVEAYLAHLSASEAVMAYSSLIPSVSHTAIRIALVSTRPRSTSS